MPRQNGEYSYEPENISTGTENNTNEDVKVGRTGQPELNESQPLANEPSASIGIASQRGDLSTNGRVRQTREATEDAIFNRLRQTPEVLSLLQAIIDDTIGPGANFTYVGPTDGESNGEESLKKAKKFWRRNQSEYANCMIDQLVVGDMYAYKRNKEESLVRDEAEDVLRTNYNFNYKSSFDAAIGETMDALKAETNMFEIDELVHVPAITIEHDINQYGDVLRYRQKVAGNEVSLDTEQIMHDSYMNLNGRTYGFTPFLSLFTEIDMLASAKNHNAKVFDNAGVVNKIFKLPDEGPNGQNYEMVKQTVAKYRKLRNKHRDLVLTGNIEIEDMNGIGDSMEFRELAEYLTHVLSVAWGVPPTRIGGNIGNTSTGSRNSQLSHEGYFKRIQRYQREQEAFLNENLFEPVFNVHIEFNHPDKKQEIRAADRDLRRLDVAQRKIAMGLWSAEKAMNYLGVDRNETADNFDEEDLREVAKEMTGAQDKQLDKESVNGDTADDAARMDLQEGQEESEMENDGVNNDT